MKLLQQDNIGSLYRFVIYQLRDRELGCDFCFGDKMDEIKKMDYSLFKRKVTEVPIKHIGSWSYRSGI